MTAFPSSLQRCSSLRGLCGTSFVLAAIASAGMVLAAGSAQAINYYWDDNGSTAGCSSSPVGTLGTSAFLNTSSTGGSGTFSSVPTAADTVFFCALTGNSDTTSAGTAYAVAVSGTQTVSGLYYYSLGNLTLGDSTSSIQVGAGGINDDRYLAGAGGGNPTGVFTINSNLVLTANQTWTGANIPNPGFVINGGTTGTANLTIQETVNRAININGSLNNTGTLTFQGGNSNGCGVVVAGAIGSNVTSLSEGLTSSANDYVTLSSTTGNAYTGTTSLTVGTLFLSSAATASLTGSGAVNVAGAAAQLSGAGGVSTGLLTVTSGGVIDPGAKANGGYQSQGILHLGTTGGVALTSATLDFDLGATAAATTGDKIILGTGTTATGALTLGTLVFNFESVTSAASTAIQTGTPYPLISAASVTGFNASNITTNFLGGLSGQYSAAYSVDGTNDLQVTFTLNVVPEPSSLAMFSAFALAFGAVAVMRRAIRAV